IEAIGTNAHELPMVYSALAQTDEDLARAPYDVLSDWHDEHDGNLRVILRRDQGIVSVPREAMQSGQDGNFVFVIEEGVAKIKKVRILRAQEGREIIGTGLDGSETVVIEGALSLRNGTKVQIRNNQTKRDS
ncbi:MAG: hypothetical protein NWT00_11450, partial [Beijerinckiaceae bacterium]|nr:hypothetical protein [Beijerinckiaceae bacterium]